MRKGTSERREKKNRGRDMQGELTVQVPGSNLDCLGKQNAEKFQVLGCMFPRKPLPFGEH